MKFGVGLRVVTKGLERVVVESFAFFAFSFSKKDSGKGMAMSICPPL